MEIKKQNLIANRYAQSLIDIANDGKMSLEEITNDLNTIQEINQSSKELVEFLENPTYSNSDKKEVIQKVYENEIHPEMINFLKILTDKNRIFELKDIITSFEEKIDNKNNMKKVSIISAIELNEEVKTRLIQKLEAKLNKKIKPEYEQDSEIIGGLVIKIDDDVIDTSIKQKINSYRNHIVRI